MPQFKDEDRHARESERRDDAAQKPEETAGDTPAVRQDEGLTSAERLPRRGDHEIPPGNDSSV